jgi:hypothetical protein
MTGSPMFAGFDFFAMTLTLKKSPGLSAGAQHLNYLQSICEPELSTIGGAL